MGRFFNMAMMGPRPMMGRPIGGGNSYTSITHTTNFDTKGLGWGMGAMGLGILGNGLFNFFAARRMSNAQGTQSTGNQYSNVSDQTISNLKTAHPEFDWIQQDGNFIGIYKKDTTKQVQGKTFSEVNEAAIKFKEGLTGSENNDEVDPYSIAQGEYEEAIGGDNLEYYDIKVEKDDEGRKGAKCTLTLKSGVTLPEGKIDISGTYHNPSEISFKLNPPKSSGDDGVARTTADANKALKDANVSLPEGFELQVVKDGDGWTFKLVKKTAAGTDAKLPDGINDSYGDVNQLIDALKKIADAPHVDDKPPVEDDDGGFKTPTTKEDAQRIIDAQVGKPFTVRDASGKTGDITGILKKDGDNYTVTTARGNKYTFQINNDGTAQVISLNGKPTKTDVYHVGEQGLIQQEGDAGYGSGVKLQNAGGTSGSQRTGQVQSASQKAKTAPTVLQLVKGTKNGQPFYTVHTPDGKRYEGASEAEVQTKLKNAGYQNVKLEQAGRNGFGTGGNKVISRNQTGPYARTAEEKKKPMTIRYIVDLNGAMRSNSGKGIKIFTPDGSSFFAVGKDIASAKAEMQKLLKQAGWTNVTLTGKTDADFS